MKKLMTIAGVSLCVLMLAAAGCSAKKASHKGSTDAMDANELMAASGGDVSHPTGDTTYKVVKGDTLSKISQKVYGTTKNWNKIYEANRDVLKKPESVKAGQKLVIPR